MSLVAAVAARTLVMFVWVLILFRVAGKRHLGQMNIYDLGLVMAVANGVQNALTGGSSTLTAGLTSATVLFSLGWILSRLASTRAPVANRLLGSPSVLVNDGHLLLPVLKREEVSEDEVYKALRSSGLTRLEQARMVVLEVDGSLSVVPKKSVSAPPESPRSAASPSASSGENTSGSPASCQTEADGPGPAPAPPP